MKECPLKKVTTHIYDEKGKLSESRENFLSCDNDCVLYNSSQTLHKTCLLALILHEKTNAGR